MFYHHVWISGFLIVGAGAHSSISFIVTGSYSLFNHRDVIIGHLIWVSIALGLHSFSLYIHNDSFEAFGRPEDIFNDNSIQFKPVLAIKIQTRFVPYSFDIKVQAFIGKVQNITQELGTADFIVHHIHGSLPSFIVHHIHAFTIHTALLILLKGTLYSRSSRLVSDKSELGFRYPCDGPGRGGTCQISPWDHIFLAVFWMYNCLSVVIFHFFWKMQSDVWGIFSSKQSSSNF